MSGLIVVTKLVLRAVVSLIKSSPAKSENKPPQTDQIQEKHWIIDGKVYDLTPFLDVHPGGRHILEINRGRDCTELFFSYHLASSRPIKYMLSTLKQYYVCDATSEQILSPFKWDGKNLEMYTDFKSRIQKYFNDNKERLPRRDKATLFRLVWYSFLFVSMFVAYKYWFDGMWSMIPVLTLIHWLLSTELVHNGTHYQVVRDPFLNVLAGMIGGFYHTPNIQWEMQHVISHHSYTNIDSLDIDLNHFLDNFRTSKKQPYREIYAKWRYFMPIYIMFASLGQIDAWGARSERSIHRAMVPYWAKNKQMTSVVLLYMLQVSWIFAILPLCLLYCFGLNHFWKAFLFMFLPRIGHGVFFYVFSQVSHIQSDAFYEEGELGTDSWLVHQILSSVDYDIHSTFWNFLSLGLNNQSIHHLCPSIHICHFMELQPVLDEFCKDYNIKRRVHPNLAAIMRAHFKHLASVNDKDKFN